MGIDDIIREMAQDELNDKAEQFPFIGVSDYARLYGIAPQKVYYYIRNKKLTKTLCECCGRGVINRADADKVLGYDKEANNEFEEQERRGTE